MSKSEKFFIAQVGKTHGLHGDLKLHLHTDFPEQFKIGRDFETDRGRLEIIRINPKRGTVAFRGYESIDSAKKLINAKIYSTLEETKKRCKLNKGEHFWFDLEGCRVFQDDDFLGIVKEIQRLADIDYLFIETNKSLVDMGSPKSFLIPNIERYIDSIDIDEKIIKVIDAKDILEAS
jgi:16S rRNA processing protein RimM